MSFLDLPLHPRLVHFPIALLLVGSVTVVIFLWKPRPRLENMGFISLLLGVILTLPAIITGLIDRSPIEPGSPADQIANLHTTAMFIMWGLYGLAVYFRYMWRDQLDQPRRRWQLTLLLILAAIALLVAADFGGQLVYQYGIGVSG
ncbi:MAG: DUF2231 domain-containing protein [Chloroflexi bacterium]|nr:DUF2231 domain-containing protein [Chloroflexota bacterium]